MATTKLAKEKLFSDFYDDGVYTSLFAEVNSQVVSAAFGYANGCPVYAIAQSGEALASKDAAKLVKVLDLAGKTGNPVVTYYNSIGASLSQGLSALADASKIANSVAKLSGVVPQIAVVAGVCGASAAVAAANADVCIVCDDAEMFFTPTFTANANGDKLKDAGTANMAQKAGVAHIVAKDLSEATAAAKKLVAILPQNNLSSGAGFEFQTPSVTLNMAKYTAQTAALSMVDGDSEVELFADFGNGIYTALATVNGNVCGVIATEKDYLCNTCTSKAARFVRLCDAFGMPVVTVVNTEGFAKSSTEDVNGGLRAAARLTATYADASTAKVCVIVGKAVGTTYTALCNADITIALENAMVAPIEPSAAVTVLYKDELDNCTNLEATTATLVKKYISEVASADKLVEAGLADMTSTNKDAYGAIVSALDMLSTKRCQRLPKKHGNMSL